MKWNLSTRPGPLLPTLVMALCLAASACSATPQTTIGSQEVEADIGADQTATDQTADQASGDPTNGDAAGADQTTGQIDDEGATDAATDGAGDETAVNAGATDVVSSDLWADPQTMVAALATPVPLVAPDGVTIDSISSWVHFDETGREVLQITIAASSDLAPVEMACLLETQPLLPTTTSDGPTEAACDNEAGIILHGIADVPLPSYDDFYDWDAPRTTVTAPEDSNRSLATTILETRRQARDVGDGIPPLPMADPVRNIVDTIPGVYPSSTRLTWRTESPATVSAAVSLAGLPEDGPAVLEWIRRQATPGSFVDDDQSVWATLRGLGQAEISWASGSERNRGQLSFDFSLGPDGSPLEYPAVTEPMWVELVTFGDSWSFDDDGAEDDGWWSTEFDSSDWQQQPAPFARDEELAATPFNSPSPGTTGWFRNSFTIDDLEALDRLDLEAVADDGFAVWINGFEVHRWNLPDGQLTIDTQAVERISGDDESVIRRANDLPLYVLNEGTNSIAVAVYQAAADSTDLRFDLRLLAATNPIS